jgi:hypothetical protein
MPPEPLGAFSLARMVEAVERVKQRLKRAVAALDAAGIPHAVAGGHAVAAWVSSVDEGGVRNTPDVDLLIRRSDLEAGSTALVSAGFWPWKVTELALFLDGPDASRRGVLRLIFAGEKVRSDDACPALDLVESERVGPYQVLALAALIRMKLVAGRLKDQVHLLDLIGVGLIDQSTVATVQAELASRLQELIDNPDS